MHNKNVLMLAFLLCGVFQCAVSTEILLNILKNKVQDTRCKLHNIGAQIIQHNHRHGNPCAQQEPENKNYGNTEWESLNGYPVKQQNGYENQGNYYVPQSKCTQNFHCLSHKICVEYDCIDPCPGVCGINAKCLVIDHRLACSCITGYTGNPFIQCYDNLPKPNQQHINSNVHLYETSNGQNNKTFGPESSTNSYQTTINNQIFKGSSNEGISNSGQEINNGNSELNNGNVRKGSDTVNKIIEDIFGTPNIGQSERDESSTSISPDEYRNKIATTEEYPSSVVDIDIRAGIAKIAEKGVTKKDRKYENVPWDGGRNLVSVNCPNGTTPTKDGDCFEEV